MVAAARELDPELILWAPTTMERHLGFVLLPFRLSALILSAFAVLAVWRWRAWDSTASSVTPFLKERGKSGFGCLSGRM